tara:strand:+ start:706 stop:1650 length:945 start_codon:yes stop_codon:yes gene_type:complete
MKKLLLIALLIAGCEENIDCITCEKKPIDYSILISHPLNNAIIDSTLLITLNLSDSYNEIAYIKYTIDTFSVAFDPLLYKIYLDSIPPFNIYELDICFENIKPNIYSLNAEVIDSENNIASSQTLNIEIKETNYDCAFICGGKGEVKTYFIDHDNDGLGYGNGFKHCSSTLIDGNYALNDNDEEPYCKTNNNDECGVCNGDNSCLDNCDIPFGNNCFEQNCTEWPSWLYDCYGECLYEVDCNGDCGGWAYLNECNACVGGSTGLEWNYLLDECYVCNGDNACKDCSGEIWGSAYINDCGQCVGGSTGLDDDWCE